MPGADKYEVQVSADAGMDSPVLGPGKDDFLTRNTRATLPETVPNGTYYWRVRALGGDGSVSPWTAPRSFRKLWTLQPTIQTPSSGASLTFPANPVVLRWAGVAGAAQYLVSVASDPALGSLVFHYLNQDDPNGPPNIAATSAAITAALAPGNVLLGRRAHGRRGQPRRRHARPVVQLGLALRDDADVDRPERRPRSWTQTLLESRPGRGALRGRDQPVGRLRAGLEGLLHRHDDRYLGLPDQRAGGQHVLLARARDRPGRQRGRLERRPVVHEDVRPGPARPGAGHEHQEPAYARQPDRRHRPGRHRPRPQQRLLDPRAGRRLGSRSRRVELRGPGRRLERLGLPLGTRRLHPADLGSRVDAARAPHATPSRGEGTLAEDGSSALTPGTYCIGVHARSDRAPGTSRSTGNWTYLQNGNTNSPSPSALPSPGPPFPTRRSGQLARLQHELPVRGRLPASAARLVNTRTPFFTWKPMAGAQSYFVVVAKDPSFGNDRRRGFHAGSRPTRRGTSSGRRPTRTRRPTYYWEVLPVDRLLRGHGADVRRAPRRRTEFKKQSLPPTLALPVGRPGLPRPAVVPLDRRPRARAATTSRSRPTPASATCSTTSSPTRPRTRATRPTLRTRSSTGVSAPTTRTSSA